MNFHKYIIVCDQNQETEPSTPKIPSCPFVVNPSSHLQLLTTTDLNRSIFFFLKAWVFPSQVDLYNKILEAPG